MLFSTYHINISHPLSNVILLIRMFAGQRDMKTRTFRKISVIKIHVCFSSPIVLVYHYILFICRQNLQNKMLLITSFNQIVIHDLQT